MQHDVLVSDRSLQKPASESIFGIDAGVRGETETLQDTDEKSALQICISSLQLMPKTQKPVLNSWGHIHLSLSCSKPI